MAHLTPGLRGLIKQYQTVLNEHEATSFVDEVTRRIEGMMVHLMTFNPGVARGREVQRLVDHEVNAASDLKYSCKKGCGACCHLEVQITSDDADVLRESLSDGLKIDFHRLRELSERKTRDVLWRAGATPMNRCVFLGADNACRNYENRPAVCRKVLVSSPPELCEIVGANPEPIMIPMAEIILSAALSIEGTKFGSLATMLQASLDQANTLEDQNENNDQQLSIID